MLFGRRIGFSGTPSDLMPAELGRLETSSKNPKINHSRFSPFRCHFEEGSEARIVHTLTDTSVVSAQVCNSGWTVTSLLEIVCSQPQYRALIDTGALITGMSNKQVNIREKLLFFLF